MTRYSKTLFDKKPGRVFALKHIAEFFKHLCFELLKPREKTNSLTESLKRSAHCLKSLSEWLKSLATCLRYNTAHGVPIRYNKE